MEGFDRVGKPRSQILTKAQEEKGSLICIILVTLWAYKGMMKFLFFSHLHSDSPNSVFDTDRSLLSKSFTGIWKI